MFKIIFLIIVLLVFLFIYSAKKKIDAFLDNMFPKNSTSRSANNNEEELIKCENCGTYIPKSQAIKKIRIGKKPLYFCSEKCKKEYSKR